jgi:membrane protein required for colicin V production
VLLYESDTFDAMSWIDLILVIPLAWAAFKGFKKGLVIEVFSLLALIVGIYGGIHFSDYVADWIENDLKVKTDFMPVISFAVTFLGIVVAVYFLGKAVERVVNMVAMKLVNKLLGLAFGILKVGLILSVILVFADSIDKEVGLLPKDEKEKSLLYEPLREFALTIIPAIKESDFYKELREDDIVPEEGEGWFSQEEV